MKVTVTKWLAVTSLNLVLSVMNCKNVGGKIPAELHCQEIPDKPLKLFSLYARVAEYFASSKQER